MKAILLSLLFLFLQQGMGPGPGTPHSAGGGGTPALLQSAVSAADNTFIATLPNHSAGGVTCALYIGDVTPTSISNTAGYTWTAQGAAFHNTSYTGFSQQYCAPKSVDASSDTVTVTATGHNHGCIVVADVSNVSSFDNPSPPQGATGTVGGSTTTVSSGTFTVTGSTDILFGIGVAGSASTAGSGFTTIINTTSGCIWLPTMLFEYQILSGTSAASTMVVPAFQGWGILGSAHK